MRFFGYSALVAAFLIAPSATAAVVTYGVDLSMPGEFQIFASAARVTISASRCTAYRSRPKPAQW